eukprot:m.128928 g.128928  ORF g.128928 m.128928 type:complete len:1275 (-) comp15840_c0_seq12:35-3859(-)
MSYRTLKHGRDAQTYGVLSLGHLDDVLSMNELERTNFTMYHHVYKLDLQRMPHTMLLLDGTWLSRLPSLITIELQNSGSITITPSTFAGLSSLALELTNTSIASFHPDSLANTTMKVIFLQNCSLTTWPDALRPQLSNLERLDLSENKLSAFPADLSMPQLVRLDLRACPLRSLPDGAFSGMPLLEELELSQSRLTTLNSDVFVQNTLLRTLSLSTNSLLSQQFQLTSSYFRGLRDLETLRLAGLYNSSSFVEGWDKDFASRHPNFTFLNLALMRLTKLPDFSHWTNLQTLLIAGNAFTTLSPLPQSLTQLEAFPNLALQRVPQGVLTGVRPSTVGWQGSENTVCQQTSPGSWNCTCSASTAHPDPSKVDACEWKCPEWRLPSGSFVAGAVGAQVSFSCGDFNLQASCLLSPDNRSAYWKLANAQEDGIECDAAASLCTCSGSAGGTLLNLPVPAGSNTKDETLLSIPSSLAVVALLHCQGLNTARIKTIISGSQTTLQSLMIRSCGLEARDLTQSVLFGSLPALKHLDISKNALTELPLAAMRNLGSVTLMSLNVSHNQLPTLKGSLAHFGAAVDEEIIWSLEEVDASHNQLSQLSRQDTPNFGRLKALDVSFNDISVVDADALAPVLELEDAGTAAVQQQRLRMQGNPSLCSIVTMLDVERDYETISCDCSSKLTSVPFCPPDPTVACDTSSNAQRIPIQSVCDGVDDCGNGADEVSCSTEAIVEDTTCTIFKDLCDLQCIGDGNIDISHGVAVYRQHKECSSDNLCTPYTLLLASLGSAVGVGGVSPLSLYRTGEGRVQLNVSAQVKLGGEAVAFPCIASFKTDNLFLLLGDPASSADPKALSRKSSSLAVIAAVAGAVLLVLIVASIIYSRRRRVREGESAMRAVSVVAQQLQATGVGKTDLLLTESAVSVGDVIGTGNFGIVHKGMYEGTAVAVKAFQALQSEEEIRAVSYEALMLQELGSHEHIVKLLGIYCNAQAQICLVLELARGGDLKTYLRQPQQAPVGIKLQVLQQLTSAVAFLHSKKILHRDLAARNVLLRHINSLEAVMLADFGLSRFLSSDRDYYQHASVDNMPYRWMALEAMTNGKHSKASDVWSLGVVMWEMFHGARRPYSSCTTMVEVLQHLQQGRRLKMDNLNLPTALKSMLQQCWHEHPSQRPTLDTISNQLTALIGSRALELEHNEEPDEMVCGLSTVFWLVSLHVCRSPTFERALTDNGSFTTPTGFSFNCLFSRTQLTHCMTICITYHHAATPSTESVFMSLPLEDSVPFET